MSINV